MAITGPGVLAALNAFNPTLSLILQGIKAAIEIKRAVLDANPTYAVDTETLEIYESEKAAKDAGVPTDRIKLQLPPTPELIAKMTESFGALRQETQANIDRINAQLGGGSSTGSNR